MLEMRFLVADEIISMLDASTRIDVLNLLGDLKERGLGVLFVTHDLSLGNYISDRTVILRRGRVVEMGATQKVFGNPRHPYTRMLLASVPQLHDEVGRRAAATRSRRSTDEHDGPLAADRRRPLRSDLRETMTTSETAVAPLTLSFMSANYVAARARLRGGRRLGAVRRGDERGVRAARDVRASGSTSVLASIAGAGFDALDLWTAHLNWRWATPEHVQIARAALDEHGLRVVSLAGNFGSTPDELASACRLATALDVDLLGGMGDVLRHRSRGRRDRAPRARRPLRATRTIRSAARRRCSS